MPRRRAKTASAAAPRRRLTAGQRRESILLVSRHAFAARGYEGVRTQDLAAVAEVSEALLYQHFTNKAELYCEVVRISSEALRERMAAAVADAPASERLERGLAAFVEFVSDRSRGWPLLSDHVSDPEIASFQRQERASALAPLVELLRQESRAPSGAASRRKLDELAEVLAGGAEALANWWAQNPKAKRGADPVALLTGIAREGLRSLGGAREGSSSRKARRK
jgi:AcrR family transcriptional regulator